MKIFRRPLLTVSALALSLSFFSAYAETNNNKALTNVPGVVQQQSQAVVTTVPDTEITSNIDALLQKTTDLHGVKINVSTNQGVVSLSGETDTDHQYETAVMLANSVDGVKNINTEELTVKDSNEPLTDLFVTAKVKGVLIKNKILDLDNPGLWRLNVETKDGVVHLSGSVESNAQMQSAIAAAKTVSGVTSVNSTGLKLEPATEETDTDNQTATDDTDNQTDTDDQ